MRPNTRESESHDTGAWRQHLGNWQAYAAAAGAALAMSTEASASIISSIPDLTVSATSGPSVVSFTAAGGAEVLSLFHTYRAPQRRADAFISAGPGLTHLDFIASSSGAAKRYVAGQPILAPAPSHATTFGGLFEQFRKDPGFTENFGAFGPGNSHGFLGFENPAGDLGWMQVQVSFDSGGFPTQLELISWAYNDVAGAPIVAGQTEEAAATPEPGTAALGLLALGAAGILALRKRRNQLGKVTQG